MFFGTFKRKLKLLLDKICRFFCVAIERFFYTCIRISWLVLYNKVKKQWNVKTAPHAIVKLFIKLQ